MAGPKSSSLNGEHAAHNHLNNQNQNQHNQNHNQHHIEGEEQYTDYSCSTSIERLSRDVETVLRSWHVDRGSDRHVSIIATSNGNGRRRSPGGGDGGDGDDFNTDNPNPMLLQQQRDLEDPTSNLIRSNTITWNVNVPSLNSLNSSSTTNTNANNHHHHHRHHNHSHSSTTNTVTIDLELALWDSPYTYNDPVIYGEDEYDNNNGGNDYNETTMENTTTTTTTTTTRSSSNNNNVELVRSLRRLPFIQMPTHDFLFDNFSNLFGIGQHISLTPIILSSSSNQQQLQQPIIPQPLLDYLGLSILQRHSSTDDSNIASWMVISTLSSWLQTSLNIALINSQCCIPGFGLWGNYQPNTLQVRTQGLLLNNMNSNNGNEQHNNNNKLTTSSSNHSIKSNNSGGVLSTITEISDTNNLLGSTILGNNNNNNNNNNKSSLSITATKGIQVFPKWIQQRHNLKLPQVGLLFKTNALKTKFWNQHFVPPIVAGKLINSSTTGNSTTGTGPTSATMWISASHHGGGNNSSSKNNNSNSIATNSRLAVWASVLLQHCPDSTVVLSGARHVFGWFKPKRMYATSKSNTKSLFFNNSMDDITLSKMLEWRREHEHDNDNDNDEFDDDFDKDNNEFNIYRKLCQAHVLDQFDEIWDDCHDHMVPLWGGRDDPVSCVYATTTWNGKVTDANNNSNDAVLSSSSNYNNNNNTQEEGEDHYNGGGGNNNNNNNNNKNKVVESLLTFPLRIRSRRELSKRDWIDMEESVEKTILDPLMPSRFVVQAYFDRDTDTTTLSANQRVMLSALIRSATLPGETLLQHLTDIELVDLWDDNAGTIVATKLADKAKVGTLSKRIVEAMDWSSIMEDMISYSDAEEIVHKVMSGELTSSFPTSPEESFIDIDLFAPFPKSAPPGRLISILFAHMAKLRALSSMALVWGVFVQELRRRWENKESLPNMQYIAGLDPHPLELYGKRCFSTIGIKANFAAFLNCSEPEPDDYNCLIGQKLQVFNIGVECIVAKEILEHETMERFLEAGEVPATSSMDDINVATMPSSAAADNNNNSNNNDIDMSYFHDDQSSQQQQQPQIDPSSPGSTGTGSKQKWPKSKDKAAAAGSAADTTTAAADTKTNYGPPTLNSDLEFWVMDEPGAASRMTGLEGELADDTGFDYAYAPPDDLDELEESEKSAAAAADKKNSKNKKKKGGNKKPILVEGLPDQTWEGTIMEGGDGNNDDGGGDDGDDGSDTSVATSCTMSQVYYDAAEAGSIFSMKNGFVTLDTVVNVADMRRRPGARCPVQGVNLKLTGDQLYAPYLQRPFPLTDDLVLERRVMLDRVKRSGEKKRTILQRRIDLAQRLQKPKLLSDMSSFKAANPNSTIDDFTKWYGNPGSPLDDYGEDALAEVDCGEAYHETAARKLDKASEAMKVLMATREFWTDAWAAAKPAPAAEQLPLFDYASTVEVVIDYMEQMHPANLVNQVTAVNLSNAYFTLISSAGDTLQVGIVQLAFKKLRQKIDLALETLSRDATGALFHNTDGSTISATSNQYTSEDAIYACEQACNALSVTETLMSRATSLLHKFPRQYDLVQDLLRFADGTTAPLVDLKGRSSFLSAIHKQQKQHSTFTSLESLPKPVLREYVFRNVDDGNPCQLAVRFGDEGAYLDRVDNEGGVLLALLKSTTD